MHKPFIYFGTPTVASETLAALLAAGYRPTLVVTSPDAPQGRGQQVHPCPTNALAVLEGIPVRTPERIDSATIEELAAEGAAYAVVVAYGKILPQALIDAFPLGILNIHYSLLPAYRGASPVEGALLAGETQTGVTIQQMVYELDAGDILAQKRVAIDPNETIRELRPRLITEGAALLIATLPAFEAGTIPPTPQNHEEATITRKIPKSAGELTLSGDSRQNWNRYRAYTESPGTFFFMEKAGKRARIKIRTAQYVDGSFTPLRVVPEGKPETDYTNLISNGWIPV